MSAADFFRAYSFIWFCTLALLIGYRILTRRINVAGMLTVDGATYSPARLQLLIATVAGLATYTATTLETHGFPEVADSLVWLFGLSHASYIGSKAYSVFHGN